MYYFFDAPFQMDSKLIVAIFCEDFWLKFALKLEILSKNYCIIKQTFEVDYWVAV